jgi:hypothetical protein
VAEAIQQLRSNLGDEVMNERNGSDFRIPLPDIHATVAAEVLKRMEEAQGCYGTGSQNDCQP